jgi:hypothetical protein
MSVVSITEVGTDAELLDAHLAFHLNAGVDVIIAAVAGAGDAVIDVIEPYERGGHVRLASGSLTELGRLAVAECGAEWIIPSGLDQFWWPRGESLKEVLAVIPPRYALVQALVREFGGPPETTGFFAEDRTSRTSLLEAEPLSRQPLASQLRPVYRATPNIEIDPGDWTLGGRRVPLRAWYPIEVLHFPTPPTIDDSGLVDDTRLRDAFRELRVRSDNSGGRAFALPVDGVGLITFPVPSVVDDAAYAIECAAVGEVDLVRLDRQIRDLEARITELEATFWPRIRGTFRRLARRRR